MSWQPSYATTEELAAFVRIGDTADDVQLGLALSTASRAIDRACSRQFGKADVPTARYYTPQWARRHPHTPGGGSAGYGSLLTTPRLSFGAYGYGTGGWVVEIDDLMTTTGLVVGVDFGDQSYASTLTDYRLEPLNAAADGLPFTQLWVRPTSGVQPIELAASVRVTASWGWSGIPDAIREATLLQASRLLSRRDSPFGVAGSPQEGSEVRLLARLDPDVAVALRPYRRAWGAV